jgi:hypothetical protein
MTAVVVVVVRSGDPFPGLVLELTSRFRNDLSGIPALGLARVLARGRLEP